uniref:ATP-dependent DNA helicase n=1 Tax=Macrostomum lignano TaxID=282301 RepID=A0A1I8J095_9PLAT
MLRDTRLIVWDEAPMTHRKDLEMVERSLRDLLRNDRPFGGALLVLAGDFRQLLAVVPGGTHANTIEACLTGSELWPHFRRHHLTKNLRLESGSAFQGYADFLMQVGNGELPEDEEGMVSLPSEILMPDDTTTEQLIQHVYPLFEPSPDRDQMFAERSILSPLNKTVDEANAACLALFPGESRVYLSVDSIPNDDTAATNFPPELLNRLDPTACHITG